MDHSEISLLVEGVPKENEFDDNNLGRTQELCNLFNHTVSSLAVDAAALKELACFRLAARIDNYQGNNEAISGHDIQNKNNNIGGPKELMNNLCHIDSSLTELEKKMHVLRDIVNEEQRALEELETLKVSVDAQNIIMKDLLTRVKSADDSRSGGTINTNTNANTIKTTDPVTTNRSSSRNNHILPNPSKIKISPVTASEFRNISKNIRGRISLAVINDAISDVQRVLRKKYSVLYSRKSISPMDSNTIQLRGQYQKEFNAHKEIQVEEHGNDAWVSESNLRHSCAFFRSGESSGLNVLRILRHLKRVKQVLGKNSEVTYVVCLASSTL